ncbi:hypothetical protein KY285_009405 [Solanum tuberosum]|nr:hypothetical protein KY285_009405 [Solanum tuberosum]
MAEKNLNANQFYITDLDYLDTVFGENEEGFDSFNEPYVDDKGKPFQNIRIKHTHILVDPFQLSYLIPDAEIDVDVDVDVGLEEYDWGPMDEELDSVTRDLPYAEIKPRDNNVLWTGDSHCYGFIEFKDKEACELAYFKMDNALIDDRTIHVGFSQSVAKSWNQY